MKKPEDITVGEIVRITEGDLSLVNCEGGGKLNIPCGRWNECVTRLIWEEAADKLEDYLDSITIKKICEVQHHGFFCQLNVFNSGEPIAEEYRDELFKQFKKIGNNMNGKGSNDGLALGLYFIKRILQKQGGDIWYEAKDKGSNFVLTIPLGAAFPTEALLPTGNDVKENLDQFELRSLWNDESSNEKGGEKHGQDHLRIGLSYDVGLYR